MSIHRTSREVAIGRITLIYLSIYLSIYLEEDLVDLVEGEGRDYIESPMSDGTIEEDFEEALAR